MPATGSRSGYRQVDGTANTAPHPPSAGPATRTASGVVLPIGWKLKQSDRFGTLGNIRDVATLSERYFEAQYYNRDQGGRVRIPNVVINGEQQTYQHFENSNVFVFKEDHLAIQGRGRSDGMIESGEMVSKSTARNWCVEARYTIPKTDKSWSAFWQYAAGAGNTGAEVDFEQPVYFSQGVHDVSMFNHGGETSDLKILDPRFSTPFMMYSDPDFDGSASPHFYTSCYDDAAAVVMKYIDGRPIYRANWKWRGPDAATIVNLAVGGVWPGNLSNPASYSGNLDLYSLDYYGPE